MTRDELINHLRDCPGNLKVMISDSEQGLLDLEGTGIEDHGLFIGEHKGERVIIL